MMDIKFLEQRLNARFYPYKIDVYRNVVFISKKDGSAGDTMLIYSHYGFSDIEKGLSKFVDEFDEVTL